MPSSYAIGSSMEEFVNMLIQQGRYNSKSEVVREALRLLQERESVRDIKLEEIRKAFQEGIDSGPGDPAEDVFNRLEEKYTQMITETP